MLVITRRCSDSIIIGDNIEIIISEISGDKVKIGINAPREISVVRKELLDTEKLNKEASLLPHEDQLAAFKSIAGNIKDFRKGGKKE